MPVYPHAPSGGGRINRNTTTKGGIKCLFRLIGCFPRARAGFTCVLPNKVMRVNLRTQARSTRSQMDFERDLEWLRPWVWKSKARCIAPRCNLLSAAKRPRLSLSLLTQTGFERDLEWLRPYVWKSKAGRI